MPQSAVRVIRVGLRGAVASALFLAIAHFAAPFIPGNILFGSYGALAVVLIALEKESVARPAAVIVAHLLAALIGYGVYKLSPFLPEALVIPLGISLVLAAMAQTDTIHPPAGGLVFVAVAPDSPVGDLGLLFLPLCGVAGPLVFLTITRIVAWLTRALDASEENVASPANDRDRPRKIPAPYQ